MIGLSALSLGTALALAAPAASSSAPARLHAERLRDGMELVVIPLPGASTTSIRYVVRAGAAKDPPGKAGLAHLLEHVVLQQEMGPNGLGEAAREAGGDLNGLTGQDQTVFTLDAPAESFGPLAQRLLRALTNPPLQRADIGRELQVVLSESEYHGREGILAMVERSIFPTSLPVLGSSRTRGDIGRDDLLTFYQRYYATTNTRIVIAGDVTVASARELVERWVGLPPALETEAVSAEAPSPELPRNDKLRAGLTAAVYGYQLDPRDRRICRSMADLLELRLFLATRVRQPLVSQVEVSCATLGGSPFLLAFAYTRTLDATDLPEQLGRAFAGLRDRPASSQEISVLSRRAARKQRALLDDPSDLATRVATELGQPIAGPLDLGFVEAWPGVPGRELTAGVVELGFVPSWPVSAAEVRQAAARAFTERRQVFLYISPFEG